MPKQIYNLRTLETVPVLTTLTPNARDVGEISAGTPIQADQMERIFVVVDLYKQAQETWFHLRPEMPWPAGWILGVDKYGHESVEVLAQPAGILTEKEITAARQALNFIQDLFRKLDRRE
jgi:hypothetical protein